MVANSLFGPRYRLFFATSGEQALRQAETHTFDLILLDVMMPGMDGFETCRRLKKLPAHRDTPVIMLTGEGEASSVVRGFDAGAVDYILKPFNAVELAVRVQTHLELRMKNEIIRREKEKSERLLLNILPRKVANELRESGTSDVQYFPDVTVLFADIVDFTKQGAMLTPRLLINELNEIFTAFDETVERHGCERIKTMGDGYLAVCGMPSPNPDHASCMLAAARELRDVIRRRNASIVEGQPRRAWKMRFGINSGDAVGGVVGVHKYIYDIFGDAVNTAARMEQLCEPMQINVSESTRTRANGSFSFRQREPAEVKGKGMMQMSYLL
jgi:class 3 adenylate cyclase